MSSVDGCSVPSVGEQAGGARGSGDTGAEGVCRGNALFLQSNDQAALEECKMFGSIAAIPSASHYHNITALK